MRVSAGTHPLVGSYPLGGLGGQTARLLTEHEATLQQRTAQREADLLQVKVVPELPLKPLPLQVVAAADVHQQTAGGEGDSAVRHTSRHSMDVSITSCRVNKSFTWPPNSTSSKRHKHKEL